MVHNFISCVLTTVIHNDQSFLVLEAQWYWTIFTKLLWCEVINNCSSLMEMNAISLSLD